MQLQQVSKPLNRQRWLKKKEKKRNKENDQKYSKKATSQLKKTRTVASHGSKQYNKKRATT